eukprot:2775773-Alexandrium_andersonii.AAC.1
MRKRTALTYAPTAVQLRHTLCRSRVSAGVLDHSNAATGPPRSDVQQQMYNSSNRQASKS